MAPVFLSGFGTASKCEVVKDHNPKPLRFVWHHILPQACGGQTFAANLVQTCDNCHYGIHVILHDMKVNNGGIDESRSHLVNTPRWQVANKGYQGAVETGTVSKIPNEGD